MEKVNVQPVSVTQVPRTETDRVNPMTCGLLQTCAQGMTLDTSSDTVSGYELTNSYSCCGNCGAVAARYNLKRNETRPQARKRRIEYLVERLIRAIKIHRFCVIGLRGDSGHAYTETAILAATCGHVGT